MRFIKEYNQFLLEEVSKNEPIPEIIGVNRGLAIFVIGAPGIGKSFFIQNHIHTKNPNIKDFSTDDVSLLYTKNPNVYYKGRELPQGGRTKNASELNLDRMEKFMETGQNFIYDTTGAGKEFTDRGFEHIKEIYDKAKDFGYKIIFIHLLSTLETSIKQDQLRDRHVDPHYIQWAYAKQMGGEIDGQKVEGNMQRYKAVGPDAYYLVTSIDKKYKFYKFIDGKLAVRKNDRYVIKESVDNKNTTDQIVETMLDFIDDGYDIKFISHGGGITYQQYLDGDVGFQPQIQMSSGVLVSQFFIRFFKNDKFKTYEDFVRICDEMQVVIARLSDLGWSLVKFEPYSTEEQEIIKFHAIDFKFKKKDERVGEYYVKESLNLENEVDKIINTMIEIIEEGETINFSSATGDMDYQDYLDKNDRYKNFKPVIVSKNKTVSKFNIIYVPNNAKYENIINILDNMQPVVGRLSDDDWVLSDFQITSKSKDVNIGYGKDASIDSLIYEFTKPDVIHNGDENSLPDSKELKRELERMGIGVSDITVRDYETEVEFFSNSYDGELRSESFYDDKFEKICDIFGFSSYDTDYRRPKVIFEH